MIILLCIINLLERASNDAAHIFRNIFQHELPMNFKYLALFLILLIIRFRERWILLLLFLYIPIY